MNMDEFLGKFENIYELFDNIESVSSRTAKEALLASYDDVEFLKSILFYTYNPYYVYGIDKKSISGMYGSQSFYTNIFTLLDYLRVNNTGRDTDKHILWSFIKSLDGGVLSNLAERIVLKDLKIGINIETINKVFPKLIPTFKVGLCKPYDDISSLRYEEYIVQQKLDGVRCIAICTGGSVELFTRNGTKIEGYDNICEELSNETWSGWVLDGEILTDNFDSTMEGLFALKKGKVAKYHIFDIISTREFNEKKSTTCYANRHAFYHDMIADYYAVSGLNESVSDIIAVSGDHFTYSELAANIGKLDEVARRDGYEGLVVKGSEACYEFKRSYAWVKYKAMKTDDLWIAGFEEGTGKYEDMLGAMYVSGTIGNRNVNCKVGSGFSDEQREYIWNNQDEFLNKKCEIKYQEITKDNSLRFPTFIKIRNDF